MNRTVFVLGAGASAPYGFPLGLDLLDLVVTRMTLRDKPNLFTQFLGQSYDEMLTFGEALARSGRTSVDAFLEHRPEFIELGKLAIAYALMDRELPDMLFHRR